MLVDSIRRDLGFVHISINDLLITSPKVDKRFQRLIPLSQRLSENEIAVSPNVSVCS